MKKFESVDEYITGLPLEAKSHLLALRRIVKDIAPQAEERLSYGIIGYFHNGAVVYIGGFKNHVSLFGAGAKLFEKYHEELKNYKTSKGTIQFALDQPLPVDLIRKLVRERAEESNSK